jgi:hypothetical protein
VNVLLRALEDGEPLVRLGVAPQLESPLQKASTFLLAVLLDQLLDAHKLCRSIAVWRNHSISVWETSRPRCPLLDSADRLQQSHLCR